MNKKMIFGREGRRGIFLVTKKKACVLHFPKNSRVVSGNRPHQKVALIGSGGMDACNGFIFGVQCDIVDGR